MTTVLRSFGGQAIALEIGRWRLEPDDAEHELLASVAEPVLDIGCGPGRIAAALSALGRVALGIDPAPSASAEAQRRGAPVLQRSVFDALPGEGRWGTALLLDGNIGIGGDPITLLERCGALLRPGGEVVAEVAPPGALTAPLTVCVETEERRGPWFEWAVVSIDDWPGLLNAAGLEAGSTRCIGDRTFGVGIRP